MSGFADILKNAFAATPQGQAYQKAKENDLAMQQKKEQNEREFADYVQKLGARPVLNGTVHRDYTAPDGSVIPNAFLDKAGADGRRVISHKDPVTGEKVQWEAGTPDEQMAYKAALDAHGVALGAGARAQLRAEDAAQAGAVEGAKLGAQTANTNQQREATGSYLPDNIAKTLNLPVGADGKRYLPSELASMTSAADSAQSTQSQQDTRAQALAAANQQLLQRQQQAAIQQLSSVTDQAGLDQVRKANPEGTADWPKVYDPSVQKSLLRRAIPIEKQVELGIVNLGDVDPGKIDAEIDAVAPPTGDTAKLNSRTKALVRSQMARGDLKGAQATIKDASDQIGRTETAVASAKNIAPIKINTAAATEQAKMQASGLTDDDLRRAGIEYAITGVMPQLGNGGAGTKSRILHYKQEFARDSGLTPKDLALAGSAFKGDTKSLENFQKQRDQITSFEATAQKNIDQFMSLADKIPDTGIPWLNTPVRDLDEKIVGSANMAAVNAARQVANNEIAKVTSGGGLSGVLSDNARKEVDSYDPKNATFAQTKAIVKVLKTDMENRKASMDDTLQEIRGRIGNVGNQATTPKAPTGMVNMKAPNGDIKPVQAGEVEHYKQKGAVVVP